MTHVPRQRRSRADPAARRREAKAPAAPVRANSRPSCATRVCVRPCSACLCAGCCLAMATAMSAPRRCNAEAREAGLRMSLSTVYNALNQFAGAGLLREIAVQGPRTYFHTAPRRIIISWTKAPAACSTRWTARSNSRACRRRPRAWRSSLRRDYQAAQKEAVSEANLPSPTQWGKGGVTLGGPMRPAGSGFSKSQSLFN